MKYRNLQELISGSTSSRAYFLSLPVDMQMSLHEYGDYIYSAEELHRAVKGIADVSRHDKLGKW